jgi:glycosyltransferase involved in cell wall biosynthesis
MSRELPIVASHGAVVFSGNSMRSMWQFRSAVILRMRDSGVRPVIVAPFDGFESRFAEEGVQTYNVAMQAKGTNPIADLLLTARYLSLYRRLGIQLAFHYTIKPNTYGSIACWILRVPSVAVVTGLGYAYVHSNWVARFARTVMGVGLRRASEVWFLNESDNVLLCSLGVVNSARAHVMPGEGIDCEEFAPLSSARSCAAGATFLYVGRLIRDKGLRELVAAFRILRAVHQDARLRMLGPTDYSDPAAITSEELSQWQGEGLVDFLGSVTDVRPFIADSDVVVLPSYREGLPRSLLEASAMEKLVIATDVPGCRDVVVDGQTGLLVPAKSEQQLAGAMLRAAEMSKEEREKFGQLGRQHVLQNFSVSAVWAFYADALRRLGSMRELAQTEAKPV